MRTEKMGSLTARIVGEGAGPVVVLLHGYGAPGTDLVPLAGAVEVPVGTRFVFPEAPLTLGLGMMEGRAWWPIDVGRYERAMMTGQMDALMDEVPPRMAEAREKLVGFLKALQADLRYEKLVLGGFSQGSMLALDTALRTDIKLAGLCLFSSTLLAQKEWVPLMAKRAGLPTLQTHGTQDPILPYSIAEKLRDHLVAAKMQVDFRSFAGGHGIPAPAREGLTKLLSAS